MQIAARAEGGFVATSYLPGNEPSDTKSVPSGRCSRAHCRKLFATPREPNGKDSPLALLDFASTGGKESWLVVPKEHFRGSRFTTQKAWELHLSLFNSPPNSQFHEQAYSCL